MFFTQALVLSTFFEVKDDVVPAYIIPFAFGNLLGPLLLGRLFDSVGRRPMITLCYVLSGVLLIGTGLLFNAGALSAATLPPTRRRPRSRPRRVPWRSRAGRAAQPGPPRATRPQPATRDSMPRRPARAWVAPRWS